MVDVAPHTAKVETRRARMDQQMVSPPVKRLKFGAIFVSTGAPDRINKSSRADLLLVALLLVFLMLLPVLPLVMLPPVLVKVPGQLLHSLLCHYC